MEGQMTRLTHWGLASALALVACGSSGDSTPVIDARPGGAFDAKPHVDAGPVSGESVTVVVTAANILGGVKADGTTANGILVSVMVDGFTLVNPTEGDARSPNQQGEGGYMLIMDGSTTLVTDYRSSVSVAIPVGTGTGAHTVKAQLVENDGSPVSPDVVSPTKSFSVVP
jgi:hypothetical protein